MADDRVMSSFDETERNETEKFAHFESLSQAEMLEMVKCEWRAQEKEESKKITWKIQDTILQDILPIKRGVFKKAGISNIFSGIDCQFAIAKWNRAEDCTT